MINIRPITDLRNKAADISKQVHESQEAVIITKQGYADMVVMSPEYYEHLMGEKRIDAALRVAEAEALSGVARRDFREMAKAKRSYITEDAKDNQSV